MDCESCGNEVAENWDYCPFCGSSLKIGVPSKFPSFMGLEDLLSGMGGDFKRMEDAFRTVWLDRKNLGTSKGGGISIRISSEGSREPKIDVRTFGDYEGNAPKIEELLGAEKARTPPKITREPKTLIEKRGGRIILKVEVPGVKSEEDIKIKRMPESIEIRAYTKDVAYFTLFCVPPNSKILSKGLEGEELVIEVGNA